MSLSRGGRLVTAVCVLATVLGLTTAGVHQQRAAALDNGLALTPPMGWNGFNHFTRNVTASTVEAEARTIVASGMKAAGYTYVNLDGGWDLLQRNAQGELQPDPAKFPDGIKPVADYVHSLGLKFGIYSDVGYTNCAGTSAASYGHYQQDADTFASWGVDYVKFDWCNVPFQDYPGMTNQQVAMKLYTQVRDAIAATGRPMVFSMCNGWDPAVQPWTWAQPVANLWRTTHDIADNYASMLDIFHQNVSYSSAASPGAWNDPDMLEVGNGGMTATEDRSHFSLWAEMAAPLLAGNDLTTMPAATRKILTNRDVIAVDQDRLGRQGYAVADNGGDWVLTKPLANGDRAVVLFNENSAPAVISTTAAAVGMPHAAAYLLEDLWQHSTTPTNGAISATVPPHAVVMYRIKAI